MRPLFAPEMLKVWEQGHAMHQVDKALTLLLAAFPDMNRDKLAALSIGQRDAYLLELREMTFGPKLDCFAECPGCKGRLEFNIKTTDIRFLPLPDEKKQELELRYGNLVLRYRMPNSLDLAAVAGLRDVDTACNLLVQRCVLQAIRDGVSIDCGDLSADVRTELAAQMAKHDPQAEVLLDLHCPECGHQWQMVFDIVSYFWSELNAQSRRLLYDVHVLAQAYGWHESDILSMSDTRRQFYIGMVT